VLPGVSVPAFRFGYGFLIGAVFLLGSTVIVFLLERISLLSKVTSWLILLVCIAGIWLGAKSNIKLNLIANTLFLPANYPTWPSEPCSFYNFKMLCQASYNSCWYSPFPCAISGNEHLEMRGKDYADGFRNVP
jgi:uncharacterized membrane protein YkvI